MGFRSFCFFFFVVGCTACGPDAAAPDRSCAADEDCVADACCHATGAVNVDEAPVCGGPCTAEFVACSDDEEGIAPVCRFGSCEMSRPPWCPVVDALR